MRSPDLTVFPEDPVSFFFWASVAFLLAAAAGAVPSLRGETARAGVSPAGALPDLEAPETRVGAARPERPEPTAGCPPCRDG
jgi:hypothetical protein